MYQNHSRDQLRQLYFDTWEKHRQRRPLGPLEAQILDVVLQHPEYQYVLDKPDLLDRDFPPESGTPNPFLHMGLHLALREQVDTDRPAGIRLLFETLRGQTRDPHAVEHKMMDCLTKAIWQAQRQDAVPDEAAYLNCLHALVSL